MADKRTDSGSETDSTEEPVVGNVNKFAVVPPNYNGKPKRGHLIFDACFESGNLGRVDFITETEYDLFIRPDTCNPRFRVWFNFTVENVKADQRIIFNIVNFSKTKSLYRDGMTPLIKSTSRPKWVRIPAKYVYYYRCPDHRKNYVMSFAFIFDQEDEVYQFAYCYPYSYTRLQNYLDNLEKRNYDFFNRELLCLTVQQRRLDLLTIASPDLQSEESTKLKTVLITARVHPGETPSSFVCQGVIDFLVSNHPIAKILREHLVFKIVPMLNPDGVYLGNYRCSLMGFDLNRHWQEPSPWAHPTLYATKNLLMELDRNQKYDMDFYIDLHAHSTLMNGFMYGNIYDDIDRYEKHSVFPKLLCGNAEDFSLSNTNFNRDAVKAGTGRRTLGSCLDESNCYTLEVSFFSYQTNTTGQSMPYTEEAYMKLGRNLARTFLDYYKLTGLISAKPSSSLVPKPVVPSNRHGKAPNSDSRSQGDSHYSINSQRYDKREDRLGPKSSDFTSPSSTSIGDVNSNGIKSHRRTLGSCLDESNCYTLEVSFFSYQTNTTGQSMPYTEEAYMKLGRNLARTFLDYYKLTGLISAKPSSSLVPKPVVPSNRHGKAPNSDSRSQGDSHYSINSQRYDKREDRLGPKSSDFTSPSSTSIGDVNSNGIKSHRRL